MTDVDRAGASGPAPAGPGAAPQLAEIARIVTAERGRAIAVTGPGAFAGQLYLADPDSDSLYNMELSYATSTALGIAVALPGERVISVEGDGSLLAGLGVLATIARYRPANLTVVVLVNGIYGTGDNSVRTQTGLGGNLGGAAIALGWPATQVLDAPDGGTLQAALRRAGTEPGPWLIQAALDSSSHPASAGRARPGIDVAEAGVLLRRALERRRSTR